MDVSADEIEHIAQLTRLGLTAREIDTMAGEISEILVHVNRLQELDTDNIPATAQVLGRHSVMRPDAVSRSLTPCEVLANAPESRRGFFVVPAVFAEERPA